MSHVEEGIVASLMEGMNAVTVPETLAVCYGSLKTHGPGGYNSLAQDYSKSLLALLGRDTPRNSRYESIKIGSLESPLLRYDPNREGGKMYAPMSNPAHLFYK